MRRDTLHEISTRINSQPFDDSKSTTSTASTGSTGSTGSHGETKTAPKSNKSKKKKTSHDLWKRCNAAALDQDEHSRLAESINIRDVDLKPGYYRFLHRCCKEYKAFIESNTMQDALHSHRDTLTKSAISQVFEQIRPKNSVPHDGLVDAARIHVLPILEDVFRMPNAGPPFGSPAWIKLQCKKPADISFAHAVHFPKLMNKLVRYLLKNGGEDGKPILLDGTSSLITIPIIFLTMF